MNLIVVSAIFCLLFFTTNIRVKCESYIDESCYIECDTQSKVLMKMVYCQQCFRMPIRFGRSDALYNNKLAIIIKSMWKSPQFHHIPQQLLDMFKSRHYSDNSLDRENGGLSGLKIEE